MQKSRNIKTSKDAKVTPGLLFKRPAGSPKKPSPCIPVLTNCFVIGALTLTYDYYWSFYEPCEAKVCFMSPEGPFQGGFNHIYDTHTHTQGSGFREAHVGFPLTNTHTHSQAHSFCILINPQAGFVGLCTACFFYLDLQLSQLTGRSGPVRRAKSSSWEHGSSEQTLHIYHDEVSYCAPFEASDTLGWMNEC